MQRTNSRCESLLHDGDELMVDVYGQIAEDLSVFGQIEVLQAVLFLTRGIMFQEPLLWGWRKGKRFKKCIFSTEGGRIDRLNQNGAGTSYFLPAVLFQTVEQLVCVRKPEGQWYKVLVVSLKEKMSALNQDYWPNKKDLEFRKKLTQIHHGHGFYIYFCTWDIFFFGIGNSNIDT